MSPGRTSTGEPSADDRREVHQPVVARPAGEPVGRRVLAALPLGDHQLDGAALERAVLRPGDLVGHRDQPLVALLHDGLRHLVVEHGGGGAGALGVLEGERAGEPRRAYDVEGGREVLLGLAGEADDDVGGDRGVRAWRRGRAR